MPRAGPPLSRLWFERCMYGEPLGENDLQQLVNECGEDDQIEWKAGALLRERHATEAIEVSQNTHTRASGRKAR